MRATGRIALSIFIGGPLLARPGACPRGRVPKPWRSFDWRLPFPKLLHQLQHGQLLCFGFDLDCHLEPMIVQSSFTRIDVNTPLRLDRPQIGGTIAFDLLGFLLLHDFERRWVLDSP